MISCPSCESKHTVKNGRIHNGKQNYRCRGCGRQFVQDPQNKPIAQATRDLPLFCQFPKLKSSK